MKPVELSSTLKNNSKMNYFTKETSRIRLQDLMGSRGCKSIYGLYGVSAHIVLENMINIYKKEVY